MSQMMQLRLVSFSAGLGSLLLFSGCAASFDHAPSSPTPAAGLGFRGAVHGGQAPIVGSAIYMFAASTSGYGTPNQSLLKTTATGVLTDGSGLGYVRTDGSGTFTITSDYTCPANDLVYLVAVGGNPGVTGTVNNVAIREVVAVSACSALTPSSYLEINEVTTVAAMVALAPFTDALVSSIATSATNVAGLQVAFKTANNLVDPSTGTANAKTPSGLGAIPVSEIYSLADILVSCVNSTGVGGNCGTLFTATTSGAFVPTDTAEAMHQIAVHPGQNVATLFGLIGSTPPFTPTVQPVVNPLTGSQQNAPTDWTVAISYTTTSLPNNPFSELNYLVLDSKSNVWAVAAGSPTGYALQLSPTGDLNYNLADERLFVNNYNQVLAVDLDDSVWFDENSYAVGKITKSGAFVCAESGYIYCDMPGLGTASANGDTAPYFLRGYGGVAIHPATNDVWVGSSSNEASAMVELDTNGAGIATYTKGSIINPTSVAVDTKGNIWFPSQKGPPSPGGTVITAIDQSGNLLPGSPFSGGGLNGPIAIAFDKDGNAWVANQPGDSLSVFDASGTPVTGSPFKNGGVKNPGAIAVDGDNHVWVANFYETVGVAEYDAATRTPISPATSFYGGYYTGSEQTEIGAVAVDASGNVWLSSWGTQSVNELVGAGAPTVQPIVLATKNGTIGTRP
jgi:sugar lactone lactonase YvrE